MLGRVKFFNKQKGYGFITIGNDESIFFKTNHSFAGEGAVGDEVSFQKRASAKREGESEAVQVKRVYRSKDGQVVQDRYNSHLHSSVLAVLPELIGQVWCGDSGFIQQEVDMGFIIGKNILVPINEGDRFLYAIRQGRKGHTRFVLDRQPEDCQTATVVLKRVKLGYLIITAYVGRISPPEPWAEDANANSMGFWNSHALIYGFETVDEESISKVCPWEEVLVKF